MKICRDIINVLNYAKKQEHEEGMAQGAQNERIAIALKLKNAGSDIASIVLATDLSEEELEKM